MPRGWGGLTLLIWRTLNRSGSSLSSHFRSFFRVALPSGQCEGHWGDLRLWGRPSRAAARKASPLRLCSGPSGSCPSPSPRAAGPSSPRVSPTGPTPTQRPPQEGKCPGRALLCCCWPSDRCMVASIINCGGLFHQSMRSLIHSFSHF